ncbi:hypothetical protein NKI12_32315 [Mesorhizobium australicum]|uniref:Uncharacterized protein n=1 Tax=Mesorhizobium australicum TaxID=536018 RepID=A0ACC6T945_9HYPH|nr:hypothetical protein [Mesorhizobium sp. LNHC229A00]
MADGGSLGVQAAFASSKTAAGADELYYAHGVKRDQQRNRDQEAWMRENGKILLQLFHACKRRTGQTVPILSARPPNIPFVSVELATRERIVRCSQ